MDKANPLQVCVHCGWTLAEFRTRRMLGCPHCYASLGRALLGDLLFMHPDLLRSDWALPKEGSENTESDPETLARWREQLGDALRREDYAEAARLKSRLDQWDGRQNGR